MRSASFRLRKRLEIVRERDEELEEKRKNVQNENGTKEEDRRR
jgi:hypothetical protein